MARAQRGDGWKLARIVAELGEHDWESKEGVAPVEVDYLVSVEGDLGKPKLELDMHPQCKWLGPSELDQLE